MRLTAAALFYEILRLDLVEIVKALVALAEAGKELLQIVRYPDGTEGVVSSGEVSVRGMYGYV